MAEIVWTGPGWYKLLSFAVGSKKVVQVSPNRLAELGDDCHWCDTMENCTKQFSENKGQVISKRITY